LRKSLAVIIVGTALPSSGCCTQKEIVRADYIFTTKQNAVYKLGETEIEIIDEKIYIVEENEDRYIGNVGRQGASFFHRGYIKKKGRRFSVLEKYSTDCSGSITSAARSYKVELSLQTKDLIRKMVSLDKK